MKLVNIVVEYLKKKRFNKQFLNNILIFGKKSLLL